MYELINKDELLEIKEILKKLSDQSNNDELISLEKAEFLTGIEYQKLRQMFLNGELPGKRFGRSIRISKCELLKCDYEDSQR